MRIAVMQPYLFPYLGYFQLISAVDKFVLLDDVNFINKGWINRNRLLINGEPRLFTVPLEKASQNKLIKDIRVASDFKWKAKTLKTIESGYRKAPYYEKVFPLIQDVIESDEKKISKLIYTSLSRLLCYMGITTEVVPSSAVYGCGHVKGQDKIIEICLKENATQYINSIGGVELYSREAFERQSLQLNFIRPVLTEYPQGVASFVGGLSIVDVLMYNSKEQIAYHLVNYKIE